MAINDKNQLRDIPIGISEDSLCSSFLLLPLELFANKSKYIYKIRTLCPLFILSITICHHLSLFVTAYYTYYTSFLLYIILWTKIYCVKNLILSYISIISALFDLAYCLLLINMNDYIGTDSCSHNNMNILF